MISLTVLTFNGGPTERLSATFDELGGSIGRADTNQLVLPDPERTISRVHAQVVFRNGGFAVVDRGSNPVLLNGRALGNGLEAPVQAGDQLQIGGYVLLVEVAAPSSATVGQPGASDPFADLAGFGPLGLAGATPSTNPSTASPFGLTASPASTDPLGMGAWGAPAPASTFGSGGTTARSTGAPSAGGIPDDWDPFAPDPAPKGDLGRSLGAAPSSLPDDFGLGLGGPSPAPLVPGLAMGQTKAEDSLDDLFGLGPAVSGQGDPLAGSILQDPLSHPNTAANADPLKAFSSQQDTGAAAMADVGSELNTPFIAPPVARTPAPVPAPAAINAPNGPAPQGAVLSWADNASSEGRTIIRPFSKPASAAPASAPAAAIPASPFALSTPSPSPSPTSVPGGGARTSTLNPSADAQTLLAAFREGLGVPTLQIDALTPELMRLVGQLLRESTQGTVDLLVARAALKREIRAEVTMIVARENNPLKFSPSAEAALSHLLAPPARGFMAAGPAMRDAYDDLRAHQFGFIAGMRAALEGVLKRFDPDQLEGKLTQKSVLGTLLPATRKARLWELFQELYGQLSLEAADDFHELFGKAFLKAYEAHIDQLQRQDNDPR